MIFEISHGKQFSKIPGKTPKSPGEKISFFLPVSFANSNGCDYLYCTHTDYAPAHLRHDTGSNTAAVMCDTT
jgi:hypothetical protein